MRACGTHFRTLLATAALAVPLAMGACDDDGTTPEDRAARVSVFLTDAPGDVEAVWLQIDEIYLQGDEGRVHLLGAPTELVEITELVGVTQLLVVDAEVDPALYGQIRLVVGDAVLLASDGSVYVKGDPELPEELEGTEVTGDLNCPSCSQSGLKITVPHDEVPVEEGAMAVVVDVDVAESFGHRAGASGMWVMSPLIHGTLVVDENEDGSVLDDLGSVSSITGTVALAEGVTIPECPAGAARSVEDFVPTATAQTLVGTDGPVVRTGTVADDGTFLISFLAADTYALGYAEALDLGDWDLTFTASVAPSEASTAEGDVDGVAYTIASAECVES